MKSIIFWCVSLLSQFFFSFNTKVKKKRAFMFLMRTFISPHNYLYMKNSKVIRSSFREEGRGNKIMMRGQMINSSISVSGHNNRVIISKEVSIYDTQIIVRGTHCFCYIGLSSTIGGARIVCMGKETDIIIGKKCMFSDCIEIWATDSHPILAEDGSLINPSRSILIDDHVWVGAHVIILKGVHIAQEAIIGMGSVVTNHIKSNTVNVGNPCRCIKQSIGTWKREFIEA